MTISRRSAVQKRNQIARIAMQIGAGIVMLSSAVSAQDQTVDVHVFDRDGQQVADVAVYAVKLDGNSAVPSPKSSAVMDQVNRQFVPHLLIVQTGTSVEFPNSDTVAHHVYSFSHPNKFVLPMYKGEVHSPVTFEHSGVVSLGCNIHDHMLGYILVVDTTEFTKTNDEGHASLSLESAEEYAITIWSPRIRDKVDGLSRTMSIVDGSNAEVTFSLTKKLNPPHDNHSDSASWSEY